MVRITAIAAVVATCLSLGSIFLETGEMTIKGPTKSHHAARSLYDLGKSSTAVGKFLATFRSSTAKKIGVKALDKLAPHLPGRVADQAAEVREAVAVLDGLRDQDIKTAGQVMTGILWSLIALHVLLILLVQGTDVETSRVRVVLAVIVSFLTTAVAVSVYVALSKIVEAANVELERDLFSLRSGAYLLPAAALVSLVTVLAMMVSHTIARRRRAAPAPTSPAHVAA